MFHYMPLLAIIAGMTKQGCKLDFEPTGNGWYPHFFIDDFDAELHAD